VVFQTTSISFFFFFFRFYLIREVIDMKIFMRVNFEKIANLI